MHTWPSLPKVTITAAALFAFAFCWCGTYANAAPDPQAQPAPPVAAGADFGTPPSGEVPILYNDHTVYTKPDILRHSRVLAAFIKDHQIYVPLRSMFEQMGATVTASADGKTFTATKPGSTVSVTLGSSEVIINGETRPLDVPPMLYQGVVLVPVRVISEALGAYVQWVPDRRLVVVRYIPPTPPPTPEPTAAPTIAPSPTPTPVPQYNGFVAGAVAAFANYNEFSAGQKCAQQYLINGGYAFPNSPIAIKVDFRQYAYVTSDNRTDSFGNHYTQFATIDGGKAFTPVFLARQSSLDGRLEFQIAAPRIYIGVGYIQTSTNYGYPHLNGVGIGIEKFPDLKPGIGFYGSAFYYPTASGNYVVSNPASANNGKTFRQQYQITKYDAGLSLMFNRFPLYLFGGFAADQFTAKQNAPIGQTHSGPYVGLGLAF